ncbi:MAG: hypothetical protein JWN55_147 [Frankiales bacterium]|nr:hypothetical protein [Frankiales bacterium]
MRRVLLEGPFYAASALLVVAGAQKVVDPAPLVRAAKSVRLRVPRHAVRLLALAEAGLGVAALALGTRATAIAVALSYAAFTAFVLLARARGGVLASCGCFGKSDLPPTRTHALLTGGFSLAALTGAPGALSLELALLVSTTAVAACAYLVLAVLPLVQVR